MQDSNMIGENNSTSIQMYSIIPVKVEKRVRKYETLLKSHPTLDSMFKHRTGISIRFFFNNIFLPYFYLYVFELLFTLTFLMFSREYCIMLTAAQLTDSDGGF